MKNHSFSTQQNDHLIRRGNLASITLKYYNTSVEMPLLQTKSVNTVYICPGIECRNYIGVTEIYHQVKLSSTLSTQWNSKKSKNERIQEQTTMGRIVRGSNVPCIWNKIYLSSYLSIYLSIRYLCHRSVRIEGIRWVAEHDWARNCKTIGEESKRTQLDCDLSLTNDSFHMT